MTILQFQDWTPDEPDFGSVGATVATNAVPSIKGYQPFPSLSIVSDALDERPRGALEAFDKDNVSFQYAGDAPNLYEFDATNLVWTEVSKVSTTYTTGADEIWSFVRWENKVLAVNFDDNPQQITMGDANFTDLTTTLKARNITVVGDFVVLSNTFDSTDGNVPNRVRWSGIGDETDFTVSPVTLSDFRDLTTGGPIRKIVGGEVGVIISDTSVFRMTFVGSPTVFDIEEVLPNVGSSAPGSITNIGDDVYFLSQRGFIELTGNATGFNAIGAGKVDRTFLADLDPDHLNRISSIADPISNRILWAYPGSGNTAGRPNKIIIYDRTFGKWALVTEEVELLLSSKGVPINLDELDGLGFTNIDTMTVSLDSDQFKGASSQLSAFDEDFKLGFFRGLNKTATLLTGEAELIPGSQAQVNAFRPLVNLGTVTGRVGRRNRQTDAVSFSASRTQSSSGKFTQRSNARFHQFELVITGDDWTDAIGVELDPGDDFKRAGKRG